MPEDLKKKDDSVLFKSKQRFNPLLKLKNKIPRINKKLIPLILLMLAIPLTVGLALLQQELRSRASIAGDGKVFLGIANETNNNYTIARIDSDLEKIKAETGDYPAVYAVWANMDVNKANTLAIFRHLESKGISPALYLMPVSNVDMERRDGRFKLASSSELPGVDVGGIKFDNSDPAKITKIYVSRASSGTENPNGLAATWLKGEAIEVFGSRPNENIDYESNESFKFEITADTVSVAPPATGYWVVSVKPLKTTPLVNLFASDKYVFISPSNVTGKKYSNANISRGSLDPNFTAYAEVIRDYGKPVLFRYAQEMNGTWFHWSAGSREGKVDTNSITDVKGYGRFKYFPTDNTPANFVKSWKHMHGLMKSIAPKTLFFWCGAGGKEIGGYFPGEEFVDYVGFDVYSGINNEQHGALSAKIASNLNELSTVSKDKKIIIGEIGIDTTPKNISNFSKYRKDWLREGYEYIKNNHPRIIGIMYFNLDMRDKGEAANNWLLWDSPEIASVYRALLLDPRFQGKFGNTQPPSGTPTNTPTPTTPPVTDELPFGYHDSASCTVITGWACDEDDFSKPVSVKFYVDGPRGIGTEIGTAVANLTRESAVGVECGGKNNHGFNLNTPTSIMNGQSRLVYAYAVDDKNSNTVSRLTNSPKNAACGGSAVTPTPTPVDPTGCVRSIPIITYLDKNKSGKRKETVVYKITIKNKDVNCKERVISFDLTTPTTRWSFSPETVKFASGETKTVNFKVTSGPYASFGVKKLDLTISGTYKPHKVFSVQALQYTVVQ